MSARSSIIVTGGAGYIGSHTIVTLIEAGYDITVLDNLVNSSEESVRRVRRITGCDESRLRFVNVDLCDYDAVDRGLGAAVSEGVKFTACIHFAGLKAVGESVQQPLRYYENNLMATLNLLKAMQKYGCKNIIFSSSATVYGPQPAPYTEGMQTGAGITNPYGRTKYMIEEILSDFALSPDGKDWGISLLRYFNPVGAHPSGDIGEDPLGIPNNLMPYVAQVLVGRREFLTVHGNDYATHDGTGVRDYIHVMDLAEGHVAALRFLERSGAGKYVHNLGTGHGYSVLDMVHAMERAAAEVDGKQVKIPVHIGPRRGGDIDIMFACTAKAERDLQWTARRTIDDMCRDLYRWQLKNPYGYNPAPSSSLSSSTSSLSSASAGGDKKLDVKEAVAAAGEGTNQPSSSSSSSSAKSASPTPSNTVKANE